MAGEVIGIDEVNEVSADLIVSVRMGEVNSRLSGGSVPAFNLTIGPHCQQSIDTAISLQVSGPAQLIDHKVMTHAELDAANTLKNQGIVVPANAQPPREKTAN